MLGLLKDNILKSKYIKRKQKLGESFKEKDKSLCCYQKEKVKVQIIQWPVIQRQQLKKLIQSSFPKLWKQFSQWHNSNYINNYTIITVTNSDIL